MFDSFIAICGPRCDRCPNYIATKANDELALKRIAKEWTEGLKRPFSAADVACDGCRVGGRLSTYCSDCDIRTCALSKQAETCAHCVDYPCDKIKAPQSRQALDEIRAGLARE
ncbi:MAG: DUF3795 domain-containing protein [Bacillota bacterium]